MQPAHQFIDTVTPKEPKAEDKAILKIDGKEY